MSPGSAHLNSTTHHVSVKGLLQTKSDKPLVVNPKKKFFTSFSSLWICYHLLGLLQPEWEFLCKNPIWFATSQKKCSTSFALIEHCATLRAMGNRCKTSAHWGSAVEGQKKPALTLLTGPGVSFDSEGM